MDSNKPTGAQVRITRNGPYLIAGKLPLRKQTIGTNTAGESVDWVVGAAYPEQAHYALCRCGRSGHKPFCDNSHAKVGFDGTETASRRPYLEQAQRIPGPAMSLTDVEALCASARFCDPHGKVWQLVRESQAPAARAHFARQCGDCPSGRLVAWDNATGQPVEPQYAPSVVLIEDPAMACSGPIGLRGGVQLVGADGFAYEVRNRMALCRCGASKNKPFCDGRHIHTGFSDER